MKKDEVKEILIIGAAGGLAYLTILQLKKEFPEANIIGVDQRKIAKHRRVSGVYYQTIHYSRGQFERLFRAQHFDVVYHLSRLSHISFNPAGSLKKRLNLNVLGTETILHIALAAKVKKIILLSTYFVYGALPDNPIFLKESAPLRASLAHPELRDVVEMDRVATNWLWQHQHEQEMVVLRPSNIIGTQLNNAMTKYLRSRFSPYPIDYNPMFQFINENDMARVLADSIVKLPSGTYNVAPDDYISIRKAKRLVEVKGIPLPISIVGTIASLINKNIVSVPDYLFDYLKYSCLISNEGLAKFLPEPISSQPIEETLKNLKT